jgi:hypothetical protein
VPATYYEVSGIFPFFQGGFKYRHPYVLLERICDPPALYPRGHTYWKVRGGSLHYQSFLPARDIFEIEKSSPCPGQYSHLLKSTKYQNFNFQLAESL